MGITKFLFFLLLMGSCSLVYGLGVDITYTTPTNYSSVNVNNSQYLQGQTPGQISALGNYWNDSNTPSKNVTFTQIGDPSDTTLQHIFIHDTTYGDMSLGHTGNDGDNLATLRSPSGDQIVRIVSNNNQRGGRAGIDVEASGLGYVAIGGGSTYSGGHSLTIESGDIWIGEYGTGYPTIDMASSTGNINAVTLNGNNPADWIKSGVGWNVDFGSVDADSYTLNGGSLIYNSGGAQGTVIMTDTHLGTIGQTMWSWDGVTDNRWESDQNFYTTGYQSMSSAIVHNPSAYSNTYLDQGPAGEAFWSANVNNADTIDNTAYNAWRMVMGQNSNDPIGYNFWQIQNNIDPTSWSGANIYQPLTALGNSHVIVNAQQFPPSADDDGYVFQVKGNVSLGDSSIVGSGATRVIIDKQNTLGSDYPTISGQSYDGASWSDTYSVIKGGLIMKASGVAIPAYLYFISSDESYQSFIFQGGDYLSDTRNGTMYYSASSTIHHFGNGDTQLENIEVGNADLDSLNVTGNVNIDGNLSVKYPVAVYSNNQTLSSAGTTSTNLINFTHNESQYLIYRNDTAIRVRLNGTYLFTTSIVFQTTAANKHVNLWLVKNGVNIPRSATEYEAPLSGETLLTYTNEFYLTTNDYLQLAWWSDDAGTVLLNTASATNPTRPESPSVVMTLNWKGSQTG